MNSNRKRIYLLDEIRGVAILLMVFYHAFFILGYEFELELMANAQVFFEPAQPFFACLFIFISGISSNLSHSNALRGAKLLLIALGFTAVTVLVLPRFGIDEAKIQFGILHLLSLSMLLFALLRKALKKIPAAVGVFVFAALFVVTYNVPAHGLLWLDLPQRFYQSPYLFALGFPNEGFVSADYFPLIPYLFMFLSGTFFGRYAAAEKLPKAWYSLHCAPLAAIGRKTLAIYIVHWPIIFLLGLIISKI